MRWRNYVTLTAGLLCVLLCGVLIFSDGLPYSTTRLTIGTIFGVVGVLQLVNFVAMKSGADPERPTSASRFAIDESGVDPFRHDSELAESVVSLKRGTDQRFRIAGEMISAVTIEAFGRFTADSRRCHGRIMERITTGSNRLVRQVVSSSLVLDFLPPECDDSLFYPVVHVRKGELEDNFRIELEGGTPVVVLTYEEYCQLMVVVVQTLLKSAGDLTEREEKRAKNLTARALVLICRRQVVNDDYSMAKSAAGVICRELAELARAIEVADDSGRSPAPGALRQIGRYTEFYFDRYPIVAILPRASIQSNRAVVKYRRDFPPTWSNSSFRENPVPFLTERIGAFFGAGLSDLGVDLRRASRGQSYHIIVRGPDNSYLSTQSLSGMENYQMVGHPGNPCHVRFTRAQGQPYTHWYFRDIGRCPGDHDDLTLHVSFAETPPSSISKAAISGIAALVLIYTVGLVLASGKIPQSDFPALILAFPALAAAWVGMDRGDRGLLGTEVVAPLSSFVTLGVSVCASALFLAQSAGVAILDTGELAFFGLHDYYWLLLSMVAFVNALLASISWIGRSIRYFNVLRGSGGATHDGAPSAVLSSSRNVVGPGNGG